MSGKKNKGPRPFDYVRNPKTNYGTMPVDILKSKEFQSLSCAARLFYCVLRAHVHSQHNLECLYCTVQELDKRMRYETPMTDIREAVYSFQYFVLPAVQGEAYGYSPQYSHKLRAELERAGFIETVVQQRHVKRCNIYAFSTNFKFKTWKYEPRDGDYVNPFWNGRKKVFSHETHGLQNSNSVNQ